MGERALTYAALIMALLIAVTYFVGLSTDVNAFAAGAQKIIYGLTGKLPSGQTSSYPSGASL